jgi:3-oxoacyl-[acyl-carrier-protein] synthase II
VLVSSTKSLVGHTMAAAGSVEAAATILALQHGLLPPTANLDQADPEMPFDCLPGVARAAEVAAALSNSFGFGGQNVSLVFELGEVQVPGEAPAGRANTRETLP